VGVGKLSPRPSYPLGSSSSSSSSAAHKEAAGDFLIYLKDTLAKMEAELSSVRLKVQKGVAQVQRERSYYRSSDSSGMGSGMGSSKGGGGAAALGASGAAGASGTLTASLASRPRAVGVNALAPGLMDQLAALGQAHDAVLAASSTLPLLAAVQAAAERG
jgi:hypothetical protein